LMPRGIPASWVIRASWPPPTMPTTGNVTPPRVSARLRCPDTGLD